MISRNDVVDFYQALAIKSEVVVNSSSIQMLPPHLCHLLLTGRGAEVSQCSTDRTMMLGREHDEGHWYHTIFFSTHGFDEEGITTLLDGHIPVKAPGIYKWLSLALDELRGIHPAAWNYIQDWCTVVVWVQRDEKRNDILELTSTSMPRLPFATFVARKIIRHVLPKGLLDSTSFYPMQENLYHEALHQQLSSYILLRDILRVVPSKGPKVLIPWRGTSWDLDRVLHACWVYRGVLEFRSEIMAASGDHHLKKLLAEHMQGARDALAFLLYSLESHSQHFTPDGCEIIKQMRAVHPKTLAA